MNLAGQFKQSLLTFKRRQNLIIFFAVAQVAFYVFGQWLIASEIPAAVALRTEVLGQLKDTAYLKPLTTFLGGNIPLQIAYTFAFNLVFGAFLTTTVSGIVFFIPYMIAVWRGFVIGLLTFGLIDSPSMAAAFYGTFILEFCAYSMSSAIGTDIGLTLLWPMRKKQASRKEALREAIRDGADIYLLVAVILFIAAVWEIVALHLIGPLF
ncbi:MAG: hypothetical protein A3J24_08385 [Deltaproteobacteria bacterium RIFCSPLOWO2_02_FULL_53_8]|nr:MAG: hypothetical protein A3J24_08385 [Deltaproteobacteria bacterium RIFCSPLOWO2_02_FULL_53_8]